MSGSKAIVFRTPGHMPIEAFTMVGVNSKPNSSNPIGFFGTGLKYAIAVLLRLEQKVTIFIGRTEYVFETKKEEFRSKEFDFVYMRKRESVFSKWRKTKLPFTLEYGKTWEIWQAYRELHTNTLDENGSVYSLSDREVAEDFVMDSYTIIVVEGEEFRQAYYDRFKTFLPEGLRERNSTDAIQVLDKPSKHIYYRGMRVFDFPKDVQSKYTYNFLSHVELTEDRTAKYPFILEARIAEMVATSTNKKFIQDVVRSSAGTFESKLKFDYASTPPSNEFKEVGRMPYARHHGAYLYYRSHVPKVTPKYDIRAILQTFVDVPDLPAYCAEFVDEAKKYLDGTYEWE